MSGKRRRTRSIAPSGRCGSVRVTWHQAASAPRWAGSASSSSSVPRSTASGRCDGRLDVLDHRGVRRRGRRAGCPCGGPTRRTTWPRGSRCSARRRRDLLAAVQVAQRGVVDPGEHRRAAPRDTPPTQMSRSDSLVTPPVTKAWAMTTVRPPRCSASARTRAIAARSTPGVGALGGAQGVGGQGRLEVGQRVAPRCRRAAPGGRRRRPRCAGAARPARAARTRTRAGWRSRGCRC